MFPAINRGDNTQVHKAAKVRDVVWILPRAKNSHILPRWGTWNFTIQQCHHFKCVGTGISSQQGFWHAESLLQICMTLVSECTVAGNLPAAKGFAYISDRSQQDEVIQVNQAQCDLFVR